MRFPSAHEGVKRLFLVEIVGLLFLTIPFLSRFLAFYRVSPPSNHWLSFSEYLLNSDFMPQSWYSFFDRLPLLTGCLSIAAVALRMSVYGRMYLDEPIFKKCRVLSGFCALCIVLRVVVRFVADCLPIDQTFPFLVFNMVPFDMIDLAGFLASALVTTCALFGIVKLAGRLDDSDTEKRGRLLLLLNLVSYPVFLLLVAAKADKALFYGCSVAETAELLLYLNRAEGMLSRAVCEEDSELGSPLDYTRENPWIKAAKASEGDLWTSSPLDPDEACNPFRVDPKKRPQSAGIGTEMSTQYRNLMEG